MTSSFSPRPLLALALVLVLTASVVAAEQLRVLHRLFHPSLEDKNFFERGTLTLQPSGQSSFEAAQQLDDDLQTFATVAQPLQDALYQVAYAPADPDAPWDVSSVKSVRSTSSWFLCVWCSLHLAYYIFISASSRLAPKRPSSSMSTTLENLTH